MEILFRRKDDSIIKIVAKGRAPKAGHVINIKGIHFICIGVMYRRNPETIKIVVDAYLEELKNEGEYTWI